MFEKLGYNYGEGSEKRNVSTELIKTLNLSVTREVDSTADIFFVRHSVASYNNYKRILSSNNPTQGFHEYSQEIGDITKEGRKLAEKKAKEFFKRFDPVINTFIFVSSNEIRALETAWIYEQEAKRKGFIITGQNKKTQVPDFDTDSNIRIYDKLGLNFDQIYLYSVFNPRNNSIVESLNFDGLSKTEKNAYIKARSIVTQDDKGSFGANYYNHSESIKNILPIKSSQDLYSSQLNDLLTISSKIIPRLSQGCKIIAFGHENYLGQMLHNLDGNHTIDNCETLSISINKVLH